MRLVQMAYFSSCATCCIIVLIPKARTITEAQERVVMTKQTVILVAILVLSAGGMSMLASLGSSVVYAAPRIQETEEPRPTPTNEPQETEPPVQPTNTQESPTNTPEAPTNTPVAPTNTPESPTDTPIPPTNEPKPTSKPKKPSKSSDSSAPTAVPPAPTAAVSVTVPSTGFGSVGGWTLGITGLVLICVLIVARRLRIGSRDRKGRSDTAEQTVNHHPPQK
jgi:outer membrane biosynthesis protein TonB